MKNKKTRFLIIAIFVLCCILLIILLSKASEHSGKQENPYGDITLDDPDANIDTPPAEDPTNIPENEEIPYDQTIQNLDPEDSFEEIRKKLTYQTYENSSLGISFSYPAGCTVDVLKNRLIVCRSEDISLMVGFIKGDVGDTLYPRDDAIHSLYYANAFIPHNGTDTKCLSYFGGNRSRPDETDDNLILETDIDLVFDTDNLDTRWHPNGAIYYRNLPEVDYRCHVIGISELYTSEQLSSVCLETITSLQVYTPDDDLFTDSIEGESTDFFEEHSSVAFTLPGAWEEIPISDKEGVYGFKPSPESPFADVRVTFAADYTGSFATDSLYDYLTGLDPEVGNAHMDPQLDVSLIRTISKLLPGSKYDIFSDTESTYMRIAEIATGKNRTAIQAMPTPGGYIYCDRYCFVSNDLFCMLNISDLTEEGEQRELIRDNIIESLTYEGGYITYDPR